MKSGDSSYCKSFMPPPITNIHATHLVSCVFAGPHVAAIRRLNLNGQNGIINVDGYDVMHVMQY